MIDLLHTLVLSVVFLHCGSSLIPDWFIVGDWNGGMAVTLSPEESYEEAALLYDSTPAGNQSCQRYLEKRCKPTNTPVGRLTFARYNLLARKNSCLII